MMVEIQKIQEILDRHIDVVFGREKPVSTRQNPACMNMTNDCSVTSTHSKSIELEIGP